MNQQKRTSSFLLKLEALASKENYEAHFWVSSRLGFKTGGSPHTAFLVLLDDQEGVFVFCGCISLLVVSFSLEVVGGRCT